MTPDPHLVVEVVHVLPLNALRLVVLLFCPNRVIDKVSANKTIGRPTPEARNPKRLFLFCHTHTHTHNLKIAVDAVRETGETWVESEKNVEKKGLVQ